MKNILHMFNKVYEGIYNLKIQKKDGQVIIYDQYEDFYYDGQDFDNALEDLTAELRKRYHDDNLYLECECPGRWIIVSDKVGDINDL